MTMVLKVGAGALVAGALGAFVAERLLTPGSIEGADRFQQWRDGVEIPADVSASISGPERTDSVRTIGLIGGALSGLGALAFIGAMRLDKVNPGFAFALGSAGLISGLLGVGILGGGIGSYALR